jgi:uncharacterized membrane protein
MPGIKSRIKNIFYIIVTYFVKGLLTLLPITLTIVVLHFSFRILKGWLHPVYELEPDFLKAIPFSEFLLTFFVILFIGIIMNFFILNSLWIMIEKCIGKIPLVRPIYAAIKQLVGAFNPHDKESIKHVVLIEFPNKGTYTIGFMTSEITTALSPDPQTIYYNVFVPATPNPTSGFYFMVAKEHVIIISLSRQEAMALIMSGGIIQPERFNEKK